MNLAQDFRPNAIKPMVCLREGWQLLKGHYWLFLGITLGGLFIGSLAALFLMGPLMCGIHLCYFRRERNQEVSFGMVFQGFDYFLPSLIATLIMTGPIFVVVFGAYLLFVIGIIGTIAAMPQPAPGQPPDAWALATMASMFLLYLLVLTVVPMIVKMLFFFTYPLIVDRGLSGVEAVKLSVKAVFGNLLGVMGVMFLGEVVLAMIGMLGCYFGFLFMLPITFAMYLVAYQQVFARPRWEREPEEEPLELPSPGAGAAETGIHGGPASSSVSAESGSSDVSS